MCPIRISDEKFNELTNFFKDFKLNVVQTTPEDHDRQAATSLALVHFLGRGLGKMGIKPQLVSTLGYERLLKVNETVENDTLELFEDMHKYNPYAEEVRSQLIKNLKDIDESL